MTKYLGYVAGALLAILPIVNPLGAVPLVMTVAAHLPEQERLRQIRRARVYTFVMMAGFLLAGGLIMSFFGISVPGMRIAGGMIVASLGFQMLFPSARAGFDRVVDFTAVLTAIVIVALLCLPRSGPRNDCIACSVLRA